MDRKRAAAALLALAACIACSSAAPTANNQTALELLDGSSDGCYYNFQHYGEGDRIMTNEPCLNCTCHKRMLMCYLRVCPFTKPIGQDCTVEKRADQCCPIVTCPDVPVDLLTSTSTSSPAEYGTTGVGKLDKYGCSINGKYFSEGSKVPPTPNKPCEHCYCIRNMTTCVMQECTLHVDGCTPIYHKDVCCPVRYSCDHEEDETLLLDDMTTTIRPTPGFLLTTTTVMPVTQITQDCVHDDQIFPDGTLIKTEKACEHCYCMKGDIVCVVQECGTPMENEGKNCTSLPPRHGQCCPDTYICEGDDRGIESTTEIQPEQSTQPPRRVGVEGSGYRNEPDEPFTEKGTFETDIEGSGEDYATDAPAMTIEDVITEKIQPDIIDEIILSTTEKEPLSYISEPDKDQNTIPDIISDTESSNLPETIAQTTEANLELTAIDSGADQHKNEKELITKENEYITTESLFKKDDNSIISDEMLTIKENEKLPTTTVDLVEETTFKDDLLDNGTTENISQPQQQSTTVSDKSTSEVVEIVKEKEDTTDNLSLPSSTESSQPLDELLVTTEEQIFTGLTTMAEDKTEILETTSINPDVNEIDKDISIVSSPGRIPGEGDCLLNGITYINNTNVPTNNNCHTSCKCVSSIIKCDPIICSSPPEYVENMNECQPIYDSPDACCPTYVCSGKETIPPESHNQMSGTESPKPISGSDCKGQDCISNEVEKEVSELPSSCTSGDCIDKSSDKQDKGDCGLNGCSNETEKPFNQDCTDEKCQILPVVACEGEKCEDKPVSSQDSHDSDKGTSVTCDENNDCKIQEISRDDECKDESCKKHESAETAENITSDCTESECKSHKIPLSPPTEETKEQNIDEQAPSENSHKTPDSNKAPSVICDENNDCKTPEITQHDECKDESCKKQEGTEIEVNKPSHCTDSECKTHDTPLSPATEETTEQNINELVPSLDSHKITDSDKEPSVICNENNDCTTPEKTQDEECKDESCKKQEDTETTVNIPSDCTGLECKSHEMSLSPITEETVEQNSFEQAPSEDSHKISDLDKGPSAICDGNNDCKVPEISQNDECKDKNCKKQDSIETEMKVPIDCSESECKTPLEPVEKTTEPVTEKISNDFLQTDVTESPLDIFTEISENPTKTDETIPEVTNNINIEPLEKQTTISGVFSDVTSPATVENDLTESPMIQGTSQAQITEYTKIEHVTESLESQDADKVTLVHETATDKEIASQEPYEPTKTESQDQADKMDATTEILEVATDSNVHSTVHDENYGTVSELDIGKEKTPIGIPELNQNEKQSTTEATGASEKLTTTKDSSEMYEIKKEKTELPIIVDDIDTQTEKISTDYDKATEIYELPQGTVEPHEQLVETHTEQEITETSMTDESNDEVTEKNTVDMAVDVTSKSPVTEIKEVTTNKFDVVIEPNNVPTELPQSSLTTLDQVVKDITEIVTEKHEEYTESSDYITLKVEETTLTPSGQPDGLPKEEHKSDVTEKSSTEKVTVTESYDISQTKTESTLDEQFVTKLGEVYTETPQQPLEKVDEISSTPIVEKKVEEPVTEKSSTQIIGAETTEKQKVYTELPTEYEQELHTTTYEEMINKEQKLPIHSSTELPTSFTISTETMKVTKDQDIYTDKPEKSVTEKELDSSDDIIHATPDTDEVPPTEVYQQFTEKSEVTITEYTPPQEFVDDDTRRQNTMQPTSNESHEINEKDLEYHKQTTTQDITLMPEATTITQDHVQVIESHTKSPSQDDEKPIKPPTEVEKESPFEMDVTNIGTVTEVLPKKPEETYVTPPINAISKGDSLTEKYETEPHNTNTEVTGETQSYLDSSTEPSKHKLDEPTEPSLPHENIGMLDKATTVTPIVEENEDKQPAVFTESEVTSHNIQETTVSLISIDEKETEYQPPVTESYSHVEEEDTVKPNGGFIINEHNYETTEKSDSDKDSLPQKTNEYSPIDGITVEISSQTPQDISTEKTNIKDTLETLAPNYIGTTQSEFSNKPGESVVTDSALFDEEKETATQFPQSYTTIEDLDKTSESVHKDTKDENIIKLPESDKDNQELTTPVYIKPDEDNKITTPVEDVTNIKQITEDESPVKIEVDTESTTQVFEDKNKGIEGETTVPDSHFTESQTAKSEDELTRQQESSTDKIKITEGPDYLTTSRVQEPQTTSSIEVKIPQQATVTEKQVDQTETVSEEQFTQPELHITDDTFASTVKEGIINIEDENVSPTLIPDFEQVTSQSPEYQTISVVSEDKTTIELKPTTISPEIHHTIITEKSPESFDIVTTEAVNKQSETERNEIDIVKYTPFDTMSTDKPATVTEYGDNQEQTKKITEVPISTVTHLTTEAIKVTTDEQIVSVTESHTKGTETTVLQYATITEEKESSTTASNISDKEPEQSSTDHEKMITKKPEDTQGFTTNEDSQIELDNKRLTTSVTEDKEINIETTIPTIIENDKTEQPEIHGTISSIDMQTEKQVSQNEFDKLTTDSGQTLPPNVNIASEVPISTEKNEELYVTKDNIQTTDRHDKFSETTQFLVELEEHTHPVVEEMTTNSPIQDIATTVLYVSHESQQPERGDQIPQDLSTQKDEYPTEHSETTASTMEDKEQPVTQVQEKIDESTIVTPPKSETETSHITEKIPMQTSVNEPVEKEEDSTKYNDNVMSSPTPEIIKDTTRLQDYSTQSYEIHQTSQPTLSDVEISSEKDIYVSSEKPETIEEKLTPELPKETTSKSSEETATSPAKPQEKPVDTTLRPVIPDVPKPEFIDEHNEEQPSPDFPPSGGYGQEPDYIDEDQAFGPGTCRYGGKVYVSAQQIPRDDPCDFCFCFRSDIICLQQSCPPPIHGCHEEPIQGFCCPRYECPVSMATTMNVTTTTTTTTTTLPPHFLPHAYKGAAQRRGCQIKGHTYKVGEVVRATSGPCLHCTCGGDGQMKCDPKTCTPEPMLRQMIAAAVSAKRRR